MRIVWCSWKDKKHPQAGGAEVVTGHILSRLVADGHEVTLLTADYPGAAGDIDGVKIVRKGNRYTVHYHAMRYFLKHLRGKVDLVVDEMNTAPFFAGWYAGTKSVMMVHQLARGIWFYQLPWFIAWLGYLGEAVYLFLLRKQPVITVSESTKKDLERYGFQTKNIRIISEGLDMPRAKLMGSVKKYTHPTMLSFGAVRAMKRTLDQVKAFELAKPANPELQLKLAGDSNDPYGEKVLSYIAQSPYKNDIECLGRVSVEKRQELMRMAHFIAVTSIKEGWGLIVSEAASQGTPAVVYDVDGLRDSTYHGTTGQVARQNTPVGLAQAINELLGDPTHYKTLQRAGWEATKELTFDNCYRDFLKALKEIS